MSDLQTLSQLIDAMNDSANKLEESVLRKDTENFKRIKAEILLIHKKISQTLEEK